MCVCQSVYTAECVRGGLGEGVDCRVRVGAWVWSEWGVGAGGGSG